LLPIRVSGAIRSGVKWWCFSMEPASITVEVVEAWSDHARCVRLRVPVDSPVRQALASEQVQACFPDALSRTFGVFGNVCGPLRRLREGDRIELYRPLLIDPKAARRERAATPRRRP